MAAKTKPGASDLNEEDLCEQAALQGERRFGELDLANLTVEVEDLGAALQRSVRSRGRSIVEHLLKLQVSRARRPCPDWCVTIRTRRGELRNDLTLPLRRHPADDLPELSAGAGHDLKGALLDHGAQAVAIALPANCPSRSVHRRPAAMSRPPSRALRMP
ncbi:MAG TPA: DUF29 family protein [Geminicoccaceae bacterium]|nr:DUF29 family protein [Geminicoccaceae bacterium]